MLFMAFADFVQLDSQSVTQRTLRSKFLKQGLGLHHGLVSNRLIAEQLLPTPGYFLFGQQSEFSPV